MLVGNQDDKMKSDIALSTWPRVEARSSRMTWPSVEVSQLYRELLNMHVQAACVTEQAWIPHERCSVDEEKPRIRSNEPTKSVENEYGA